MNKNNKNKKKIPSIPPIPKSVDTTNTTNTTNTINPINSINSISLPLIDYLKQYQYLLDEGFTITQSDDPKTLTIGIFAKEINTRFYYHISCFTSICHNKTKIDITQFHGPTKQLIIKMNEMIDIYKEKIYPKISGKINKKNKDNKDNKDKKADKDNKDNKDI